MKRAVIYARVSTDDQRSNYSIPTQVAGCLAYIEERGYTLVGDQFVNPDTGQDVAAGGVAAYVDDFTSRELSRPSLDAALRFAETVGYDVLVVMVLDRLARDQYIRRTLELEFEKQGVIVEYVQGDYDETPEGEVRKDLDATFAKWENARRLKRSLGGKHTKAKQGVYVGDGGRGPFGYTVDQDAPGGLAVNQEQAAVIGRIFDLYTVDNLSIRGITALLTSEGVKNHSGKTSWARSAIKRILHNETYAGSCYYNKNKRVKNGRAIVERDREDWIEIPVTPIIDRATFDLAQKRLVDNKKQRRREPNRTYLLTGMIFCQDCRKAYIGYTAKAGRNRRAVDGQGYRHRAKEGHCLNKIVSAQKIDPIVWQAIENLLLDPASLHEGYEAARAQYDARTLRYREHLARLQDALQKVEAKRHNLTAAYIDPDVPITKADYLTQRDRLDREEKNWRGKLPKLARTLATPLTRQGWKR